MAVLHHVLGGPLPARILNVTYIGGDDFPLEGVMQNIGHRRQGDRGIIRPDRGCYDQQYHQQKQF